MQAKLSKVLIGYRVHDHDTREYQRAGGRLVATHDSRVPASATATKFIAPRR